MTLWGVASLDIGGAYHYNPLDARQIGKLIAESQGNAAARDADVLARPTCAAASPEELKIARRRRLRRGEAAQGPGR